MLTSVQTGTEVAEASSTLRRYVQYCELIVVQGVYSARDSEACMLMALSSEQTASQ